MKESHGWSGVGFDAENEEENKLLEQLFNLIPDDAHIHENFPDLYWDLVMGTKKQEFKNETISEHKWIYFSTHDKPRRNFRCCGQCGLAQEYTKLPEHTELPECDPFWNNLIMYTKEGVEKLLKSILKELK